LPAWLARPVHTLGRTSYALFLLHFPLLLLGNALYAGLGLSGAGAAAALLLATWVASVLLALGFERWVEAPLGRMRWHARDGGGMENPGDGARPGC
jgi:peptidoglycan/LPS O-acetylase OafA/YrhL